MIHRLLYNEPAPLDGKRLAHVAMETVAAVGNAP